MIHEGENMSNEKKNRMFEGSEKLGDRSEVLRKRKIIKRINKDKNLKLKNRIQN